MIGEIFNNQQNDPKSESEPMDQPGSLHQNPEPDDSDQLEPMRDNDFFRLYEEELKKVYRVLTQGSINEYNHAKESLKKYGLQRHLEGYLVLFFSHLPANEVQTLLAKCNIPFYFTLAFELATKSVAERSQRLSSTTTLKKYIANFNRQIKYPLTAKDFALIKTHLGPYPNLIAIMDFLMLDAVGEISFREAMIQLRENGFTLLLDAEGQRKLKRLAAEKQEQLQAKKEREQKKQETKEQEFPNEWHKLQIGSRPAALDLRPAVLFAPPPPAEAPGFSLPPPPDSPPPSPPSPIYSPGYDVSRKSGSLSPVINELPPGEKLEQEGSKRKQSPRGSSQ